MAFSRNYILIGICTVIIASCSSTRKVPDGDALYTGARVNVSGQDLSAKKKKELRQDLEALTRPRPNKQILGVRWNLMFYNMGLFKKKLGEPPVLLSQLNLDHNIKVLQSSLENRGYFHAKVQGDTVVRRKKARAVYSVQPGPQYFIAGVSYDLDSSELGRNIAASTNGTLLKSGEPFDLGVIKAERDRIDFFLKERGFYFFNPDYIIMQVDSTIGDKKVNLRVRVKPETPDQARNIYRINDVFIFPNYRLQAPDVDTIKDMSDYYKGYYVVDKRKRYNPRMFDQAMQFDPGDVYNRTDHNRTISRLVNLTIFKFVKNRFEVVEGIDSAKLNAFYYLTPLPKKSIRAEINANTKSNNMTGSSITVSWRNRNTFRGGEILSIEGTGGFEVQYSGQMRGFNTFRYGLETSLSIPRFVIPFFTVNTTGGFMPQTTIMLGYELLTKQKLYTMQSFKANYGYLWKESLTKEHTFNPISVNYVQPLLVTDLYKDSTIENPTLLKAIERQFILGSNYNYTYNSMYGRSAMSSGKYFNGNLDFSGNIAGLITGGNAKEGKQAKILNAPFSQYVRVEGDYRQYIKTGSKSVWANRAIVGIGLPYGNSRALPYIKQFFVGGTNSVRAFRSRSIGPGTYRDSLTTGFLPDQSGDVKVELNTEWRMQLSGFVHGALFIDAGNIWLVNADSLKPGAKFSKEFLSELAVGGGIGLRFDVSFLVVRLDVAIPFRKPWLPKGQRWVLGDIDFGSADWRRENIVWNLGIGYPF